VLPLPALNVSEILQRRAGVLVLLVFLGCTSPLSAQVFVGRAEVEEVTGNASYSLSGAAPQPLGSRTRIEPGTTLRTGAGSTAMILVGGSAGVLKLNENSTLVLDRISVSGSDSNATVDIQATLAEGNLLFDVNRLSEASRFEIKVPAGVAGIRGGKGSLNAASRCVLIEGLAVFVHAPPGKALVPYRLSAPPSMVFTPEDAVKPLAATEKQPEMEKKEEAELKKMSATLPSLKEVRGMTHQILFSGDYFLGQGDVTLPLGFSLASLLKAEGFVNANASVASPKRSSDYLGATLSYSYGQTWYVDLQYAQGKSSGKVNVDLGLESKPASDFEIKDTTYQLYVRYAPRKWKKGRFSTYLRAGFTYVDTEMTDTTTFPLLGFYREDVDSTDLLGNLGFGVRYKMLTLGAFRLSLQGEGEAFAGVRSQDITESLPQSFPDNKSTKIDNFLYGGLGRGTLRGEYWLGRSESFRLFVDAGFQAKFTQINYPDADTGGGGGSFSELLWGPYVKLGLSYSF